MRFSEWFTFDQIDTEVPNSAGLFQVRVQEGLLNYPRGRSAMFYYGYASDLVQGLHYYLQEILPYLEINQEMLLVRFLSVEDFETRFQKQLHLFAKNFGSLPLGNQLWLSKRPPDQSSQSS